MSAWGSFESDSQEFEQGLTEMMTRAHFEHNVEKILDLVERLDLPDRIIHRDVQTEQELMTAYVNQHLEQKLEEVYNEGSLTHEKFRLIAMECFEKAYDVRELQAEILNTAAMLVTAIDNPGMFEALDAEAVEIAKKEFMAELRVHLRLKKDDKWLLFFDHMVPAAGLNASDQGDMIYFETAEDSLDEFERKKAKKRQVIKDAKIILSIDDEKDDMYKVLDVTGDLMNLHAIASAPVHDHETVASREASIRVFIAGCNLTDDLEVQQQLVDLFNTNYPLNDK